MKHNRRKEIDSSEDDEDSSEDEVVEIKRAMVHHAVLFLLDHFDFSFSSLVRGKPMYGRSHWHSE